VLIEEIRVLIPFVAVRALDEADIRLGKTAGEEALPTEIGGLGIVEAVELLGGLGFNLYIEYL